MRTICTGWYGVHADVKVLRDDGKGGLDSHSICIPCRDKFIAELPPKKEETHAGHVPARHARVEDQDD